MSLYSPSTSFQKAYAAQSTTPSLSTPSLPDTLNNEAISIPAVYHTRVLSAVPPSSLSHSNMIVSEDFNSSPFLLRPSMYVLPGSSSLDKSIGVPFSLHVRPFDLRQDVPLYSNNILYDRMSNLSINQNRRNIMDASDFLVRNDYDKSLIDSTSLLNRDITWRCSTCRSYLSPSCKYISATRVMCGLCNETSECISQEKLYPSLLYSYDSLGCTIPNPLYKPEDVMSCFTKFVYNYPVLILGIHYNSSFDDYIDSIIDLISDDLYDSMFYKTIIIVYNSGSIILYNINKTSLDNVEKKKDINPSLKDDSILSKVVQDTVSINIKDNIPSKEILDKVISNKIIDDSVSNNISISNRIYKNKIIDESKETTSYINDDTIDQSISESIYVDDIPFIDQSSFLCKKDALKILQKIKKNHPKNVCKKTNNRIEKIIDLFCNIASMSVASKICLFIDHNEISIDNFETSKYINIMNENGSSLFTINTEILSNNKKYTNSNNNGLNNINLGLNNSSNPSANKDYCMLDDISFYTAGSPLSLFSIKNLLKQSFYNVKVRMKNSDCILKREIIAGTSINNMIEVSFSHLNNESTFTYIFDIDETTKENENIVFQVEIEYNSFELDKNIQTNDINNNDHKSKNINNSHINDLYEPSFVRKVLILNLSLPSSHKHSLVYNNMSWDSIIGTLMKQYNQKLLLNNTASINIIKDPIIKCLSYYRKYMSNANSNQLVLPENIKLAPLFLSCIMKHSMYVNKENIKRSTTILKQNNENNQNNFIENNNVIYDSSFINSSFKISQKHFYNTIISLPLERTIRSFYPRTISISEYFTQNKFNLIRNSISIFDQNDIYIIENGQSICIYLGKDTALTKNEFESSDEGKIIKEIIEIIENEYNGKMESKLIKQGNKDNEVREMMVEDALNGIKSYADYLCEIHFAIRDN